MIFKYHTKLVGEKVYLTGWELVSEPGVPTQSYEVSKPFGGDLRDSNGKLQWAIRDNPDYNPETDHIDDRYIIECDPIQPTPEELEAEKQAAVNSQLVAELPDIIRQNKDNPEALVQALCDRAKQIEVENAERNDIRTDA